MSDQLRKAVEHHKLGRIDEAERLYQAYAHHHPQNVAVHQALSHICYQRGQVSEAIGHMERAHRHSQRDAGICFSLGALYAEMGNSGKAIECFGESLRLQPNNDEAWSNLGVVHYELLNYGASIECLTKAMALNTRNEGALFNLGLTLTASGSAIEANRMFQAACDLAPANNAMQSCRLFNLHNAATLAPDEMFNEHRHWAARFDAPTENRAAKIVLKRDRTRIRVGYISPDFKRHSVFYFIHPILKAHDRSAIECYCYSDVLRPDDATQQLVSAADHWRDISRLNDEQVFRQIRDDEIDILVDLAGHTDRNRLPLFATRPAPVQVSWIGYPDTTGLCAMDYRFTDSRADPEGASDVLHTETLVRLESGFLCYEPPASSPDPAHLPARRNGYITFGSFNNLSKVSAEIIQTWSEILRRVPGSKLVLKAHGLGDASVCAMIHARFRSHGIDTSRVECLGHIAEMSRHLAAYHRIDIALDTYPYHGTTTTCEALWMGVPVVTWAGDRHVSRVGKSLLTAVGLASCVADDQLAYIDLAVILANDPGKLEALRDGLRERMRNSPLMDAAGFTQVLERHFRRFAGTIEFTG